MTARPSVVFFGMGPVALASVEYIDRFFDLELVVTKPGQHLSQRSKPQLTVSQWAHEHHLPILEISDATELEKKLLAHPLRSKVGVVVDFGIIITKAVIDYFPLGILNSHFSLLPQWRGADPITFAVLSGQKYTGVSIMRIAPALDEGDLLAQHRLTIGAEITTPQLTTKLVNLSNKLLATTIPAYLAGVVTPHPQDPAQQPTYSRKIHKEDGKVDWSQPAEAIERHIRAYMGWPGSFTDLDGTHLILTKAHVEPGAAVPGRAYQTLDRRLVFGTSKGLLVVERLKREGKTEMEAAAYLNGRRQNLPQLLL